MKFRVVLLSVLLTGASAAPASEPLQPPLREKALMVYFSKSFGGTQRQNRQPLAFGLRLQQTTPFDVSRAVSLLDMRYSLGGRKALLAADVLLLDSSSSGHSLGVESWKEHWGLAVGVGVGVVVAACAFRVGICEHGHSTDTSTNTGGNPTGPG